MTLSFVSKTPQRPFLMARRHAVVSGHCWASLAGLEILEAGGNAVDAGVATALATNVLEPEMCQFLGVAPLMIYLAAQRRVVSFVGVGPWPRATSSEDFRRRFGGRVPKGVLHAVVPATPANYLKALERFGTMSFGEVASAAIRFARDGFPVYPSMREIMLDAIRGGEYWSSPANDAIFKPNGRVPHVGEIFVQADLAHMLQYIADEEAVAAGRGRKNGLQAAYDAVYRGDIARRIVQHQKDEGGLLTEADFGEFDAEIEVPHSIRFCGAEVYSGGPWGQGPMILGALNLLRGYDLRGLGHNSAAYIHTVVEALKLAAADREMHFGDPRAVDVPVGEMLSEEYASRRRTLIDPDKAWPGMPPAGTLGGYTPPAWTPDPSSAAESSEQAQSVALETSYLCVVDKDGNAFSATPSDPAIEGPVVPGLGLPCCTWGSRAYTGADHPARVEGGRRPRMSTAPQIAIRDGEMVMPFGSPGSEVLGQAQLQVLINIELFGMDPQTAVEAPRFASYSWPASILPHTYLPGRLVMESRIDADIGRSLSALGHEVHWWAERSWRAGSVCVILHDVASAVMYAGADHRRSAYAVGW